MVGRILRVTPTKKNCIVIDCGNNFNTHGLPQDYRYHAHKPKKENAPDWRECPNCGAIEPYNAKVCSICGYEFNELVEENENKIKKTVKKKEIERLIKIKSMQDELYSELRKLVLERGYKRGFSYYLFRDLLQNGKSQGTGLVFYKKIMRRIEKCREKNYKLMWLKYQ